MQIGFDGKRATQNFTGLGNYSRYILQILSKYQLQNSYLLYSPKSPKKTGILPSNIQLKLPERSNFKTWWRSFGIIKDLQKDKIDLFHGLSNEIPFGLKKHQIPSLVTIHDLIFLRFPKYYKLIDRIIYQYKFKYACANADHIVAVSDQTKRDIIRFYKTDPSKISVVYQSCDSSFRSPVDFSLLVDVRLKYKLPDKFILNVGSIEERKNVLVIVKALKQIPTEISLVIIGKETAYADNVKKYIADNGLSSRVHLLNNVSFADLPAIYQSARTFVYPSKFEGFGIPILEALYSGVPVIAATGSCLEEAGGPSSKYIHPDNDIEFAKAINEVNQNSVLKAKMIEDGYIYAKKFDDQLISKQITDLYIQTINNAKTRNR